MTVSLPRLIRGKEMQKLGLDWIDVLVIKLQQN